MVKKIVESGYSKLNSDRIEYYLNKSRNNIDIDTAISRSIDKYVCPP